MMDEHSEEWRNLTFSQRVGKAPLPEPLQAGKLTKKFRNRIWHLLRISINNCCFAGFPNHFASSDGARFWESCFFSYHFHVLDIPDDEIPVSSAKQVHNWLRDIVLQGESHEVLAVLEYILRFPNIPAPWAEDIKECFKLAPYVIDTSGKSACIVPTTSTEMAENVERSLGKINQSELTGTKSHFRNASHELNDENYAASIRESIHAVEAAVRKIDPLSSKSLSTALDSLQKNGLLKHSALKEGINKLYGYTSDEEGIRHPLIEKDTADVGFDEAIFMYGACVSFVDYLVSKKRQQKEK